MALRGMTPSCNARRPCMVLWLLQAMTDRSETDSYGVPGQAADVMLIHLSPAAVKTSLRSCSVHNRQCLSDTTGMDSDPVQSVQTTSQLMSHEHKLKVSQMLINLGTWQSFGHSGCMSSCVRNKVCALFCYPASQFCDRYFQKSLYCGSQHLHMPAVASSHADMI